jgi:DNA (cytosine-5)-methyltransferase 1
VNRAHPAPEQTHPAGPQLLVGSLCTGYGGLDLAVELVLGGQLAWYAETDRHAQTVLSARWPAVTNLGDIRTIDWTGVPPVDVLTAGFPCQDISNAANAKASPAPTVDCGTPSSTPFARFDHRSCSWKTWPRR